MRVNISTFDPRHWQGIVESIIWNLAEGGGAVGWELTNEGRLHMWLHTPGASSDRVVIEHKPVVVTCKLGGNESGTGLELRESGTGLELRESTRTLKILAKFPATDEVYGYMLGVTDDGLWFGSPRRYYDDVDHSGLELDELNALGVEGEVNCKMCVMYDPVFFSGSGKSCTQQSHHTLATGSIR